MQLKVSGLPCGLLWMVRQLAVLEGQLRGLEHTSWAVLKVRNAKPLDTPATAADSSSFLPATISGRVPAQTSVTS